MALRDLLEKVRANARRGQQFVPGANLPKPKFLGTVEESRLLGKGPGPTREQALETALSIGPAGAPAFGASLARKVLPKAAEVFEQGLKNVSDEVTYKARQTLLKEKAKLAVPGPKGFGQKVKEFFEPIRGLDNETKEVYKTWTNKRLEAKALADEDIVKLKTPIIEKKTVVSELKPALKESVEESIARNSVLLETAQKGERIFLETGEVKGVSSTFPKWVPEGLRSRKLFDSFAETASTPGKKLGIKEQRLFDAFKKQIETETGFKNLTPEMLQSGELKLPKVFKRKISPLEIPDKEGLQAIRDYQAGVVTPNSERIKLAFDDLFKEAEKRGLNITYRARYLPQVYDSSASEIQDASLKYLKSLGLSDDVILDYLKGKELPRNVAASLKINPFFSKARLFPDYETAMKFGLRPKYTNPAQLVAHYRKELEETIANKEFLETLLDKGKLLPEQMAPKHYQPIAGNSVFKGYFASPELKKILESKFRDEEALGLGETLVKWLAWGSRKAQELALSAGVPYSNINFFSIGQLVKQMTAGDFKSAAAFIRANFNGASIKYFQNNQEYMQMMANQGLDLGNHIASYGKVYRNLSSRNWRVRKTWANWFERNFDKMWNEKTFGSFMPQMHIQTFKDAYKKGLVKGMNIDQAESFAARTTRAMFGLFEDVGRGPGFKDAMSATFFAPQFREGVVRTLFNTIKSVTTEIANPAFYKNRQLLGGMVLTYGAYNALNKQLTGHYMWDNPPGKEFALMIPTQDGTIVYFEYMPSFLSFARNMVGVPIALVKADTGTAGQKFGSLFSMPIRIVSEILTNRDYFGRPIYNDYDSLAKKAAKSAEHFGLGVGHPYIKETVKQIEDKENKTPLYQSIVTALELPLRFSSESKISTQKFYDDLDKIEAKRAKVRDRIKVIYNEVQELKKAGKNEEALKKYNDLPDEDKAVYQSVLKSDKRRKTNSGKAEIYDLYLRIQEMKANGEGEAALELFNTLSEEDKRSYLLVKKQFDDGIGLKPKKVPDKYGRSKLGIASDYVRAFTKDPGNAFRALFTKEKLGIVKGNLVELQRFYGIDFRDQGGSQEYKRELMSSQGIPLSEMGNWKLEHITPVKAGGSTADKNLMLVNNEMHDFFTPIDIAVGNAVKNGIITRKKATKLMIDFKVNKTITAEELIEAI